MTLDYPVFNITTTGSYDIDLCRDLFHGVDKMKTKVYQSVMTQSVWIWGMLVNNNEFSGSKNHVLTYTHIYK